MKDYIGKKLNIGDKVVYVATGKNGFMVKLDTGRTVWPDHLVIYGDVK